MDTDVNHVTLTGTVERAPSTRFADHGTQQVSFPLRLEASGPAGQAFQLSVPCEAYSQMAEAAGDLNAGDAVVGTGQLPWTSDTAKEGAKKSRLAVWARLITVLVPATVEVR
jgi:hypothetical protein